MNWKTTGIVISREYLNKVKKKSFIWTTLLVPILVAGLTIGIMVAMMNTKEKTKTIAVVDESGIVLPYLTDTETIHYQPLRGIPLDSIKTNLASYGFDGVLSVGPLDSLEKTVPADLYSPKPFGMDLVDNINGRINRAVEAAGHTFASRNGRYESLSSVTLENGILYAHSRRQFQRKGWPLLWNCH